MSSPAGGVLGVGVIGAGYWGPNLVRNFSESERAVVRAVSDQREERLAFIGKRAPGARLARDAAEVFEAPDVDAIAITTPVSTHYELARAALDAGKHVLVAKPLAATTAEADALIALAAERDRVLMVDHTFVYTGAVRKMAELISTGQVGELFYYDSVRVNLGLFQHDVDVIWDLAAHDLSIVAHLLPGEPRAVSAVGASHSGNGFADVAYVTLEYENDLIAHCHVNWLSPVKIRQTLLGGSERMLVWNDLDPDEKVKVYDRGINLDRAGGERLYKKLVDYRIGDVWTPQLDRREALAVEVDHFVDCVEGRAEPITGGAAGRQVVRLLEAASASLRERGRAVDVGELVAE
jgi:predicted dehydrogenase